MKLEVNQSALSVFFLWLDLEIRSLVRQEVIFFSLSFLSLFLGIILIE